MNIKDMMLYNAKHFYSNYNSSTCITWVRKNIPIHFNTFTQNEEKIVGTFIPLIPGNSIMYNFQSFFSSNNRWQVTINVYEDDNDTPIATTTSAYPSGSGNGVSGSIAFNVKAFSNYKITVSFNGSSSFMQGQDIDSYIDYYVHLADNFSIIKEEE